MTKKSSLLLANTGMLNTQNETGIKIRNNKVRIKEKLQLN
jgi:hypothetical protein